MTDVVLGTLSQSWIIQHDFPARAGTSSAQECLLHLKSDSRAVNATIFGAFNRETTISHTSNVNFRISPSPIAPAFIIEHCPYYGGPKMSIAQKQDYENKRVVAEFSGYCHGYKIDDASRGKVYSYTSKSNNTPPTGPHSFSNQLRNVRYALSNAAELPKQVRDLDGVLHVFCWKADSCIKYAFDQPMPIDKQNAHTSFKQVIDKGISNDMIFFVAFRGAAVVPNVYWSYFAALPPKYIAPYWPWVGEEEYPNREVWKQLLYLADDGTLEQHPMLVQILLAQREKKWQEASSANPKNLPDPLKVAKLFQITRFRDGRQYLATTLGSQAYEEAYSAAQQNRSFNGQHDCEIFSKVGIVAGTRRYLITLNPQPKSDGQEADLHAEGPAVGEQVQINITIGGIEQVLQGTVVRIPPAMHVANRRIAISASSQPFIPISGRIVTTDVSTSNADFLFGQHAQNTTKVRERLIALMVVVDEFKTKDSLLTGAILRELLLAQDLWQFAANHNGVSTASANLLPDRYQGREAMLNHIRVVCTSEDPPLTSKQIQIVEHYFTHLVTLVRGPPGTGKTTLIDVIARLENDFHQRYWMCTESNAACDVLVEKAVRRYQVAQPHGMLRVRPSTQERFDYTCELNKLHAEPLEIRSSREVTLRVAVDNFLKSEENVEKAMGLENLLKSRITHWQRNIGQESFPGEWDLINKFSAAAVAFQEMALQGNETQMAYKERQQKLEKAYFNALSRLQVMYVGASQGVYSTAAASSGRLLGRWCPHGMVMDEASQFQEASAAGAIAFAAQQGHLRRVMLIGDDMQLPPTVMSPRNAFSETSKVSLFERLIKAGMVPLTLDTQYRMEPTISSASKEFIYKPISVHLQDGQNTFSQNGAVQRFRKFLQGFAHDMAKQTISANVNSVIISPSPWSNDPRNNLSYTAKGSTSKYNLGSAWIVVQTVARLMKFGYESSEIMIISFYTDQVLLLRSLFAGVQKDGKPMTDGLLITTVDGSQGRERPVTVVDTVLQGAANSDGMGFLGTEKRRFNVALSRAQAGRILVANDRMVTNAKDNSVWGQLIELHRSKQAILNGKAFQTSIITAEINDQFLSRMKAFHARAQRITSGAPQRTANTKMRQPNADYARSAFMRATHASVDDATRYLDRWKYDIAVAIDKYLSVHGSDVIEVEEI